MNPLIATAGPADAPTLTDIAFAAKRHWGYRAEWILAWSAALTISAEYVGTHATYKAVVEGETVGFCAVVLNGTEAVLDHLWVVPRAMRRGVGRQLFEAGERYAREQGADRLKIVGEPNAEGFYLRMGATPIAREFAPVCGVERWLTVFEKRLR